jgi:hypothetical protein
MHGPVNVVAHDYAVSEYKIHMFAREDNTDAGDGDPVKGTDEPVAAAETRGEGDDNSLSEADLRDQFQNDFEYLLPPFGSPQVDVVHDPRTGKDEVIITKRVHQVQVYILGDQLPSCFPMAIPEATRVRLSCGCKAS